MIKQIRKRKCKHCHALFIPDARNVKRQRFCSKQECRKASKAFSQGKWLEKEENKNYFRGSEFDLIDTNIICKIKEIKLEFYQEPKILEAKEKIKVFATYYTRKVYADFYPETKEVSYQGKMYSPSGAADAAKKNISGKKRSTNGWEF